LFSSTVDNYIHTVKQTERERQEMYNLYSI